MIPAGSHKLMRAKFPSDHPKSDNTVTCDTCRPRCGRWQGCPPRRRVAKEWSQLEWWRDPCSRADC